MRLFHRLCEELPRRIPNPFFVKVGANDGLSSDPCSEFLLADSRWRGLLIEPVPYLVEKLKRNFPDPERFSFEEAAVGVPSRDLVFYYVDPRAREEMPALPPQFEHFGGFNRANITDHLDGVLEPYVLEAKVNVLGLPEILERHGIRDVHLLQVDTEGHDFEVLKTYDFSLNVPEIIFVEHVHVTRRDTGLMVKFLEERGYSLHDCGTDFLALNGSAKVMSEESLFDYLRGIFRRP